LSHFLEHLIFKGTKKYPADEISKIVETQGGVINAATSKEFTYFYIDTYKAGAQDSVKILADAMGNITLPPDELERERPVVLEEIARHNDNPGAMLYDVFTEALFPDSPYKPSVLGSSDVIKNVSRAQILDYYKAHYVPANMVMCIVGDINPDEMLALVKDTLGKLENRKPPAEPSLVQKEHKGNFISLPKDVEQTYSLSGFLGPDVLSEEQGIADVSSVILGGGRTSRLYRKLREEKRLVYGIGSSFWGQRGTGAVVISSVFAPENQKAVLEATREQVDDLAKNVPSDEELKRAKEILKSQWYFGNETYHDLASLFGYWETQGNPAMIEKYIAGIESVTKNDVLDFFKKYYNSYGLSTSIIAPKNGTK
jgi:predicted Zn-dependent peptidase